jgi:hypothetical protein
LTFPEIQVRGSLEKLLTEKYKGLARHFAKYLVLDIQDYMVVL